MRCDLLLRIWSGKLLGGMVICFLGLFLFGCESVNSQVLPSAECMLINAYQNEGFDLIQIANTFSDDRQHDAITSHPVSPRYLIKKDGGLAGEISLVIGMGPFGAQLTLWVFEEKFAQVVDSEFRLLMSILEEHGYELTPCANVEGYRPPVRIGADIEDQGQIRD